MRQASLFLVAWLFCNGVTAANHCDDSFRDLNVVQLQELIAPLEKDVLVRSNFEQKRVMRLLKKPLLANGNMIFAPGLGLYWQLEKPFNYQLIMTSEQFTQINGEQKQTVNASDQPAMFAISKIFADLFAGDFLAAQRYFSFYGKPLGKESTGKWSLCLIPVQEPFNKLIASIQINGGKKVDSVSIYDVSDDYTKINFTDQVSDSRSNSLPNKHPLTDAEKAYFRQY